MNDFIQEHQKVILGLGVGLALLIIAILLFFLLHGGSAGTTTNTATIANTAPTTSDGTPIVNNEPQYSFIKNSVPEDEQYLLLEAKILAEEYGTYSAADYTGLFDVKNQATSDFETQVQATIDFVTSTDFQKDAAVSTVVDPNSLKLVSKTDTTAAVTMNADYANQFGQHVPSLVTVTFVKQGNYWLVDAIAITQK